MTPAPHGHGHGLTCDGHGHGLAAATQATGASAAPTAAAAITLHDLTLAYAGHPAVHHVSGSFAAGSMTAIVGPNGAGKSSLLTAIMGRIAPAQGRVEIAPALRGRIAWMPQRSEIDRSFPLRVFDLVAMGLWRRSGSLLGLGRQGRVAVMQALSALGLAGFENRLIAELSAGQFQRVLFARVLLQDAPVILLDEPFSAIDFRTTDDLLALMQRWHGEGRTLIAVLHDLEQVRAHFGQCLLLARRCIAWGPTAQVLQPPNLDGARRMSEAWDEHAAPCHEAAP